jgi:hypothetical protein
MIFIGSDLQKMEEFSRKIDSAFEEIRDIKAAVDRAGGMISPIDIELTLYHVERLRKVIDGAAEEVLHLINKLYSQKG